MQTTTYRINVSLINEDKGYIFSEWSEDDTWCETPGEIYKASRAEYGRCVSKVYVDTKDGTKAIGWVFQKRNTYDDTGETYLQEAWVSYEPINQ